MREASLRAAHGVIATYTRAAVVANAESVENRMMHRGTISEWDDFGAGPMYFDRMVADSRGPK